MVPQDATATPIRRYTATVISRQILYHGRSYVPGDTIELTAEEMTYLRAAGSIGDIKRVVNAVETAVTEAPENTARNYGRRPR